jgi:hypothetical protein
VTGADVTKRNARRRLAEGREIPPYRDYIGRQVKLSFGFWSGQGLSWLFCPTFSAANRSTASRINFLLSLRLPRLHHHPPADWRLHCEGNNHAK